MITTKIGGVAFAFLATLLLVACGDGSKEAKAPAQEENPAQSVETVRAIETQTTATALIVRTDQPLPKPRPNVVVVSLPTAAPVTTELAAPLPAMDPISQLIDGNGNLEKIGQSLITAATGQGEVTASTDPPKVAAELSPGGGLAGIEQVVNQVNPAPQVTQLLKPVGPGEPADQDGSGDPIEALVEIGTQQLIKSLTQ